MKIMLKMMTICFDLIIQCHFYDGKKFKINKNLFFINILSGLYVRRVGFENGHAAVRVTKSRKMVGFISAVPIKMKVYDK